jgi:DNA invertase Pin-like site-specific DNA recombinase
MEIIPKNYDDLTNKIQGLMRDMSRPDAEEKAAIYTRVSRIDPRHHGYSMDIQPDKSEEYARSKGWDIYAIYEDPAKTGRNSRRPSLQKMIGDIRAGQVTIVVVHRLDRLYRNLESLLKFIRMIKAYKVRLVSVTEQIDTDNWWGRLVLYVLGALAEMYIWQSSARTREAKLERVMNGLSNASFRFGYCNGLCSSCKDPNGKGYCPDFGKADRPESQRGRVPVPHPVEKHAVRIAASLYNKGKSDLEIAVVLNSHNFRLPDGSEVTFRTKGLLGQTKPGPFSRDSIRDFIRSPYYVGLVAHYPTRPLDMDDDPENPKRKSSQPPLQNKRQPQVLQKGLHEPLYTQDLWESNMQLRASKGTTPTKSIRPRHEYLLTGIGRCWVCMEQMGEQVGFRGSTGDGGLQYYRCATVQDKAKGRSKPAPETEISATTGVQAKSRENWHHLIESHKSTMRADWMEEQVENLLSQLVIPEEWYEQIMAYYLSDHGMADFERDSYNLRQELNRAKELYTNGFINLAQFQEKALRISKSLEAIKPAAQPEAHAILPSLKDFKGIWRNCTAAERRKLLKVILLAVYFDASSTIQMVLAHNPFDQLLTIEHTIS